MHITSTMRHIYLFIIILFLRSFACHSQDSRKELATDIEDLKKKIAGTGE